MLHGLGSPKAYVALAGHLNAVRQSVGGVDRIIYEDFILALAESFVNASARFDKIKFLVDCGIDK